MAKKYNLLSKSDMRKFQRDLEKTILKETKSAISKGKYDVPCPHCDETIVVPIGKSSCPCCHNQIDLTADFT